MELLKSIKVITEAERKIEAPSPDLISDLNQTEWWRGCFRLLAVRPLLHNPSTGFVLLSSILSLFFFQPFQPPFSLLLLYVYICIWSTAAPFYPPHLLLYYNIYSIQWSPKPHIFTYPRLCLHSHNIIYIK